MKKIHKETSPRLQIGAPFVRALLKLLASTNNGNLSNNWNITDMTRYAISELYKRTGEELPVDAKAMLKRFDADLDDNGHSG